MRAYPAMNVVFISRLSKKFLKHIEAPITFAASTDEAGLQAIDLALYMLQRRAITPLESNKAAQRLRDRLMRVLDPMVEYFQTWQP